MWAAGAFPAGHSRGHTRWVAHIKIARQKGEAN
jgi:hypothetical protein